jgi:hypothetical protein
MRLSLPPCCPRGRQDRQGTDVQFLLMTVELEVSARDGTGAEGRTLRCVLFATSHCPWWHSALVAHGGKRLEKLPVLAASPALVVPPGITSQINCLP